MEYLSSQERIRERGLFTLEKKRLRGELVNTCKYLTGKNEQEETRLFSVRLWDRTRSNGHKLKSTKFHLNTRKHFIIVFIVIVINYSECGQTLEQVAQRAVELSVEILNT